MAKDDMEVIMFKILTYLYQCMKFGKVPDLKDYGWESQMFSIPNQYWCSVLEILIKDQYVDGFGVLKTKDGTHIQMDSPASITYKGREFLTENSKMQKVKSLFGKSIEVLLSSIFGTVISL